ncbi:MAG: hypothetical protein ACOZE5_14145 [Verrucomicrobiota bacterium]
MKTATALLALLFLLAADAAAQSSTTPPVAPGATSARPRQTTTGRSTVKAKVPLPDPDLLDGSKYEEEKRPLFGMLSEIEMGEQESDQQDRISPNSGPQGQASPETTQAGGGAQQQQQQQQEQQPGGGSSQPIAQGPQAQAMGAQAQSLQVPQGAQAAGGPEGGARDMQIGDATLQIQTVPQTPDMIGSEASKAQQYEKKVPPGQQTNNRNQGVEKGKVIPKGL